MYKSELSKALSSERANKAMALAVDTWRQGQEVQKLAMNHYTQLLQRQGEAVQNWWSAWQNLSPQTKTPATVAKDAAEYAVDSMQRSALFLDVMRRRGNNYLEHEAAGCPPVLVYDYEMIVDGRELLHPVNYALVEIKPPEGVELDPNRRPFVIVDPRAGHGAGIGGFKSDSQVGVALQAGHPVYFVIFFPEPEKNQTLAHVCDAEVQFLKEVKRRHPDSPKPVVIGNCQGGWAVMLMAAYQPDIAGPIVMNGAPLSYWAGKNGKNPMRYMGGLFGGALPVHILSDLGNGRFDGANLVMNFEQLNPGNAKWDKYYQLYSKVDTEAERFLDFERWWGGFYFMNEQEIHWIVENLFIGNKLVHGKAELSNANYVDLKQIRSPIVVFASHGDNITPPQQALNWIADTYRDEHEIKARGQRIVYMVHEDVGHLGIFVSASVALREHTAIMSTLEALESLPPGLYEMQIADREIVEEGQSKHQVTFEARTMGELLSHDETREEEAAFTPVSRLSDLNIELYDMFVRPFVRSMVNEQTAQAMFQSHPLRRDRRMLSDRNPLLWGMSYWAKMAEQYRKPMADDNVFRGLERLNSAAINNAFDLFKDSRDAGYELAFHCTYGLPAIRAFGKRANDYDHQIEHDVERHMPEIEAIVDRIEEGGLAEAVVRMLLMVSHARGAVPRARLKRFNEVLRTEPAFLEISDDMQRSRLIHEQTVVVNMEPELSLHTLPKLLKNAEERRHAMALLLDILGGEESLQPSGQAMVHRIEKQLKTQVRRKRLPEPEKGVIQGEVLDKQSAAATPTLPKSAPKPSKKAAARKTAAKPKAAPVQAQIDENTLGKAPAKEKASVASGAASPQGTDDKPAPARKRSARSQSTVKATPAKKVASKARARKATDTGTQAPATRVSAPSKKTAAKKATAASSSTAAASKKVAASSDPKASQVSKQSTETAATTGAKKVSAARAKRATAVNTSTPNK